MISSQIRVARLKAKRMNQNLERLKVASTLIIQIRFAGEDQDGELVPVAEISMRTITDTRANLSQYEILFAHAPQRQSNKISEGRNGDDYYFPVKLQFV